MTDLVTLIAAVGLLGAGIVFIFMGLVFARASRTARYMSHDATYSRQASAALHTNDIYTEHGMVLTGPSSVSPQHKRSKTFFRVISG